MKPPLKTALEIETYTVPHHVSVTSDPLLETSAQMEERHGRFLSLPEPIQDKLVHAETGRRIYKIGQSFQLNLPQMSVLARAVRSYYFGDLPIGRFPEYFSKELTLSNDVAQKITSALIQDIIRWDLTDLTTEPESSQYQKLTLDQIFHKYPRILDTYITENEIMLKGWSKPAPPSLKNWITAYHQEVGAGTHESIQRGNFLFQSPNTQNLSRGEKIRLLDVLKALDENAPLLIDPDTQKLIFSDRNAAFKEKKHDNAPQNLPNEVPQKTSPLNPTQATPAGKPLQPEKKPEVATQMLEQTRTFSTVQRMQGGSHNFSGLGSRKIPQEQQSLTALQPKQPVTQQKIELSPSFSFSSNNDDSQIINADQHTSLHSAQKKDLNYPDITQNIHFTSPHKLPGEK